MANLVSQLTHCGRGDEMIVGDQSHIFFYEQGGSAAIGGIHPRTVINQPDGTIAIDDIEAAIRPDNVHFPRSRLIVLENTHNRCSGSPLKTDYMRAVKELARRYGLKIHVDGARIFNAAMALNVAPADLLVHADSVSFCLSKGLAAPVGSMVCANKNFIENARRARKVVGGGMRQAGVLAAAGIVALTEMVERLRDDHANARKLAQGLMDIDGLRVDIDAIKTNIIYIQVRAPQKTAQMVSEKLAQEGVHMLPTGRRQLRAVTHYQVDAADIEEALKVFRKIF
jgi:threonine aldolase